LPAGITATPTNGQIPIGNGTGYTTANITAGSGITVTNGSGSISIAASSSGLPGVLGQVFTSNGTFTIPTGVTALKVTVVGGGGAGGGYTNEGGGGGGAGATAIKYLTGLTAGNTLSVVVGSGGTGGGYYTGNAGGQSYVASGTQTISTISANGGSGGQGAGGPGWGMAGGAGGTASGGTINITGQSGGAASVNYSGCGVMTFTGVGGSSTMGLAAIIPAGHQGGTGYSASQAGTGYGCGASGVGGTIINYVSANAGIVIFEW
jgi:hypothetical protein